MIAESNIKLAGEVYALHDRLTSLLTRLNAQHPLDEKEFDIDETCYHVQILKNRVDHILERIKGLQLTRLTREDLNKLRFYNILTKHVMDELYEIQDGILMGRRLADDNVYGKLAEGMWILNQLFPDLEEHIERFAEHSMGMMQHTG